MNSLPINIHETTSLEQFKKLLTVLMTHYDFRMILYCVIMFPHVLTVLCNYLCIFVLQHLGICFS